MNKQLKERWLSNFRDLRRPEGAPTDKRLFNLAEGSSVDLYLYDEIGYWGITAGDFVQALSGIDAETINLHINSPGGDVYDGLAILNALRNHKATIVSTVDGLAASAASFIAMAGDEVVMAENSQMMIHDAIGITIGNAEDHAYMVEFLGKQSDNIASIYAKKAGGSVDEWRTRMKAETWYGASDAVDAGLADRVEGSNKKSDQSSNKTRRSFLNYERPAQEETPAETPSLDAEMFAAAMKEAFA